jgi:hypothetical protein
MSMASVHHVLQKSQSKGSARTLALTVAIHANDCCGVAWPSDTTLRHEVNVSRQRIHELKNMVEDAGELLIIERPGTTNLYFVAVHGKPLGPQGEYLTSKLGTHQPGCPLRDPALRRRYERQVTGQREERPEAVSERVDPPVDSAAVAGRGVSDPPDPQRSEIPDGGCQKSLTQKTRENKREKKEPPAAPFSLSLQDGADAPERYFISPEIVEKFGLRYTTDNWPPRRREKD